MKKFALIAFLVCLLPAFALAQPTPPPIGAIYKDTNCDQTKYNKYGILCHDTDDGKLYKWSGVAMAELDTSAATGDMTKAAYDGDDDGDIDLGAGGTGAALTDPNADRILFWDDSATSAAWLAPGTGLSITTTNLNLHGYLQDIAGLTGAQGDILYFDGTDWKNLAPGTADHYLQTKGAGQNPVWAEVSAGHAAVTLDANAAAILDLSTQEIGVDNQDANTVFAGPTTGAAATPDFRALVSDDIPDLSGTYQPLDTDLTAISGGTWTGASSITTLGTITTGTWTGTTIAKEKIAADLTAANLGATLTFSDGDLIDLSGITQSANTAEGLVLPTWADVTYTGVPSGSIAWSESSDSIKIKSDAGWQSIGATAAPIDATYWTSSANATLSDEANLGLLTTGLVKITVAAGVATPSTATAGTDYLTPSAGMEDLAAGITGIVLGDGTNYAAAVAGTDYAAATSGTSILKGDGAGGFSNATFADVAAGTNANALVIGTGGTLGVSGTGTINATALGAKTWAAPDAIGSGTPAAGTFTNLAATGTTTIAVATTGMLRADSGVVSAATAGTHYPGLASANTFTGNNTFGDGDTDTLTIRSLVAGGNSRAVQITDSLATPTYATGTTELYVKGDIETDGTVYAAGFNGGTGTDGSREIVMNTNTGANVPTATGNKLYFLDNVLKVVEDGTAKDVPLPADSVTWTGTSHSFAGVTNFILPTATPDANGEVGINNTNETLMAYINSQLITMDFTDDAAGYVLKSDGSGNLTMQADATAGSPTLNSVGDPTDDSTITMDAGEEVNFDYTGAFTTGSQYKIEQKTGNPSGGTLFEVKAADTDVTLAKFGDGTNYLQISQAGNVSHAGTSAFSAPRVATSIAPNSADGATLGTSALEWSDAYFADGAVIYGQTDGSNTLTSAATGWTAAKLFTGTAGFASGNGATGAGFFRLLEDTDNGTDYSTITGKADAGTYPGFTLGGSQGSEDMTILAADNLWTFASTTGATFAFTPSVTFTAGASFNDQNITNVGDIAIDSISADGTNISIVAASGTVTVESVVFTGGALSSVASITDGTASWSSSSLSGFADITTTGDITVGDDLLVSDGGVVNFNAGDVTLTHSSNTLTVAGGDLALGANNLTTTTGQIQVGDSATYLNQPADGYVGLTGDTGVRLTANDEDLQITKNGENGITLGTSTGVTTLTTPLAVKSSSFMTGLTPPVIVLVPSGVHDGGDDQAIMTDAGIDIGADALVGMTVYNVTDGSSCTITANAATTITCTLAGGTGNDWDDGDVWQVGPGPYQSGSMFYVGAAGTIRHPATVGYVAGYYATAAAAVIVEMASDSMVFQGVVSGAFATLSAGNTVESPATAGSFYMMHNKSATAVQGLGFANTWIDGGAT